MNQFDVLLCSFYFFSKNVQNSTSILQVNPTTTVITEGTIEDTTDTDKKNSAQDEYS